MSSTKPTILYVAYHYPPIVGSSGVHRTVAFTRHLVQKNWQVNVLTASLKAYLKWSEEQIDFIPDGVNVIRAYGRDVSRHFSWRKKYLGLMALPDNWQSWIIGGVIAGLWNIVKNRPDVIVSTYPIASAHFIAYFLHKLTGVPWVADLRDPMAQEGYPSDPRKKRWFEWIERKIVKHCKYVMVTAPGAKTLYEDRFPQTEKAFWKIVPNGFDLEMFKHLESQPRPEARPFTLLHSGVIYPSERDPSQFFAAISRLKQSGDISAQSLRIVLRATGHDDLFSQQIKHLSIDDIIELAPTIHYKQALQEMFDVDGLLLLQAANCNYQIPAKAYEYIRVGKPVLGLTPIEGDTGQLIQQAGVGVIAPLDDENKIVDALKDYLSTCKADGFDLPDESKISTFSRQHHATEVEKLLSEVINGRS